MSVNAGRISEQVVLPYLEKHFGCKGEVVDADGYDHLFKNGIKNEHKKSQRYNTEYENYVWSHCVQ